MNNNYKLYIINITINYNNFKYYNILSEEFYVYKKIKIKNFKCFKEWFTVKFNPQFNIIVGDNDVGKSTILEAINLALTGIYRGKNIKNELSQYLFNKDTIDEYLNKVKNNEIISNKDISLPEIIIEVYFNENSCAKFLGNGNSDKSNEDEGFIFKVHFNEEYSNEYKWKFIKKV